WLQVDLGYARQIFAIDTMGYRYAPMYVKTYRIKHSWDGNTWMWYGNDALHVRMMTWIFQGNTDNIGVARNYFDSPVEARFVRIYPSDFQSNICTRWELYTC
ncbi:hypothetical protein CAPTEDRAFT_48118, partial [Capitella teleta]